MKAFVVAATFLHLAWSASIADVTCPDSCTCQIRDQQLEISCTSFEFIKKLLPKQEANIVRLDINNVSLENVDLKLKYLKNLHVLDLANNNIHSLPPQFPYLPKLKTLNLSRNRLSEVVFAQLPKNVEEIDLSHNSIVTFPKDWSSLKQLKTVSFQDNPIDCDCDNLSVYEQLYKASIIRDNLTCSSPKDFYGQSLNSINCTIIRENLLNSMLGDEGSGEEIMSEDELHAEGYLKVDDERTSVKPEEIIEVEGSGDEGSGFQPSLTPILPIEPKACHFNCSTPKPVGINDDKNASPMPSIPEQAKILFEDIFQPEKVDEVTQVAVKEKAVEAAKKNDKDVETFPTNDTVVGEMERASLDGDSSTQSVYIIVGLLVAFGALLVVYFLNKRRNQKRHTHRRRNKATENGIGEEMKPLGKSALKAEIKEPIQTKAPETSPLLNGKNGKVPDEHRPDSADNDFESVELRKPDSLTPQPERVTIKAGEIPDSIPKTPLLVHRQVNSDGEVVTTAVNSN